MSKKIRFRSFTLSRGGSDGRVHSSVSGSVDRHFQDSEAHPAEEGAAARTRDADPAGAAGGDALQARDAGLAGQRRRLRHHHRALRRGLMRWLNKFKGADLIEGWHLDQPQADYQKRVRCHQCGAATKIAACSKDDLGSPCAPGASVYFLRCPATVDVGERCNAIIAVLQEGTGESLPLLNFECGCEFADPLPA